MSDECPHGLGDPAWCSVCKYGPTRPELPAEVEYHFTARYEGRCGACRADIAVGERCAHLTNGANVHAGCA